MFSQMTDPIVGLLCQDHACFCSLERSFARRDYLGAGTSIDIGELSLGHDLRSQGLISFCECFWIIYAYQYSSGGDILAAHDRDLRNSPVYARCNVEPRGIYFTL